MKIGIKTAQDFVSLLIRRRWWVIAPFIFLFGILGILTKELPRIYVSESLVLVRPRDVPENFVIDLISGSTEQRLRSIQQTVMSRANIVAILNEFKDRLPEFQRFNIDEAVEKLRGQIDVKFDIAMDARGAASSVTSFRILYQHRDPETAQKICAKLTSLFIDQDSRSRESHVYGTTDFLKSELDKKSVELELSEVKLRDLRGRFQSELPQQLDANQRRLEQLNEQKRLLADIISRAASQRFNLQQMLATVDEFLPPPPVPSRASSPAAQDPVIKELIEEFRRTDNDLSKARILYTDKHQDIQNLNRRLEDLRAKIPPDVLEAALKPKPVQTEEEQKEEAKPRPNPQYVGYTAALRDLDNETTLKKRELDQINIAISNYGRRVDNTPNVELQLSALVRENTELRKEYDELKSKLNAAELSESLESKQRAQQFVVLDQANFPIEPSKPNKWAVLAACFVISLALAIGVAVLVDISRQRIWTQSEIETLWGVPVMVDIPEIVTDGDVAVLKRKKWVTMTCSMVGLVVFGACLYGIYVNNAAILAELDPVLEQLVYR